MDKSIDSLIYKYGMKKKYDSKNASKKFFEYLGLKEPVNKKEEERVKQRYFNFNVLEEAINNKVLKNNKYYKTLTVLAKISLVVFYLLFILGKLKVNIPSWALMVSVLVSIVFSIVSGIIALDIRKKSNFDDRLENKLMFFRNNMSKNTDQAKEFVKVVKKDYHNDSLLYNELIKLTTLMEFRQKQFVYVALSAIRSIVSIIFFIVLLVPFVNKIEIVNVFSNSVFSVMIYISIISLLLDFLASIIVKKKIKENINKVAGI